MHTPPGGRGRMAIHIRRREFIFTLGGAAAAWPRGVRAQQARRVMRVGFFGAALTASSTIAPYQAFLAQLLDLGLKEGVNIAIEDRRVAERLGTILAADEWML